MKNIYRLLIAFGLASFCVASEGLNVSVQILGKNLLSKTIYVKPQVSKTSEINHDVGILSIDSPPAVVDSPGVLIPRVKIYNYGSHIETVLVICRIADWQSDDTIVHFLPNTTRFAVFDSPSWIVGPRGYYTVKCSTGLPTDQNPANDTLSKEFRVRVRDVGVAAILNPSGDFDSAYQIRPKARIKNFGTEAESLKVYFRIGTFFDDTIITLPMGGDSLDVEFEPWLVRRGSFVARCSTSNANDVNPNNDFVELPFRVRVHDVGVLNIIQPMGILDSSLIIPQATVINYGTEIESFNVRFSIWDSLAHEVWATDTQVSLNPGEIQLVELSPWIAQRGRYQARCQSMLELDMNRANDTISTNFSIMVRDLAVLSISEPTGAQDSTGIIRPRAWVRNLGTEEAQNVAVRCWIAGVDYADTQEVSLAPLDSTEVMFRPLALNIPRGVYTLYCRSDLENDLQPANDEISTSFTVEVSDIGIIDIISPELVVESTATLRPRVRVKNLGTRDETFEVVFRIGDWRQSREVSALVPDNEELVEFDNWIIPVRGNYLAQCSLCLSRDLVKSNDTLSKEFQVIVRDFAISGIWPEDSTVYLNTTITPRARVTNLGSTDESDVLVRCYIPNTSYYAERTVSLACGQEANITFDDWLINLPDGRYQLVARAYLNRDCVPVNDSDSTSLYVIVPGWIIQESVPVGYEIKDGGALTSLDNKIYALVGGNTNYFLMYDLNDARWRARCSLPFAISPSGQLVKKRVKAGGALTAASGMIYAFKGNNTTEFWAYDPARDSWIPKAPIPEFASATMGTRKRVKSGASLVTIQDSIYALKGGNSEEFWVYDVCLDTWYARRSLIGPGGKKPKAGAALTTVGGTVYALLGGNTCYFYQYLPGSDSWVRKADARFGDERSVKRKLKDGACLAAWQRYILAFKGGNTKDFGCYDIDRDTWFTLDTIPGNQKIKAGGALVTVGNLVYAIKGGRSREFWRYALMPSVLTSLDQPIPTVQATNRQNVNHNPVVIQLNNRQLLVKLHLLAPTQLKIALYNAIGQKVALIGDEQFSPGEHKLQVSLRNLSSGVYYLKLQTPTANYTAKAVLK
ncbi:MAG: T9SS type A sorting domain-containing protein [candidate division WOR-3 bacterium]